MTVDVSEASQTEAVRPSAPAKALVRRGWTAMRRLLKRRRNAGTVERLSDAQLGDMGLTRSDVRAEVGNAWFWD